MTGQIIHIEQCGFLTTLQDAGRQGFLQYGVSKGGAMDLRSAFYANCFLGNDENEAVLEITQSPHRFLFLQDTVVAFTGGGLQPQLNDQHIPLYQPVFIPADGVIEFKQQIPGFRLYMAVAGGFKSDEFLYSHSTNLLVKAGGHHGRALKKEDLLQIKTPLTAVQKSLFTVLKSGAKIELNIQPPAFTTNTIRVMHAVEWNYLNDSSKETVATAKFKVSPQSNRMGYRLKGEPLETVQPCEIISSAVTQGTVQLTSSGEMIVLMADAQTVGGYPRIAQVCTIDLSVLAQKKPGNEIQFQFISLQEAEELYLRDIEQLNTIKQTLQQLYAG
ncbi:MAG: biotin-dependent carboxyltransferase family protein [Lacibacter sp.]